MPLQFLNATPLSKIQIPSLCISIVSYNVCTNCKQNLAVSKQCHIPKICPEVWMHAQIFLQCVGQCLLNCCRRVATAACQDIITWTRDNVLPTPGYNIHQRKLSKWPDMVYDQRPGESTTWLTQPNIKQVKQQKTHNWISQLMLLTSSTRSPPLPHLSCSLSFCETLPIRCYLVTD